MGQLKPEVSQHKESAADGRSAQTPQLSQSSRLQQQLSCRQTVHSSQRPAASRPHHSSVAAGQGDQGPHVQFHFLGLVKKTGALPPARSVGRIAVRGHTTNPQLTVDRSFKMQHLVQDAHCTLRSDEEWSCLRPRRDHTRGLPFGMCSRIQRIAQASSPERGRAV